MSDPDIVLILLGANDAKASEWRSEADFVGDYEDLIEDYENLPGSPKVWVVSPLPAAGEGNFDILPEVLKNNVTPAVRKAAATANGGLIDLAAEFDSTADLYLDNIHPNRQGTRQIARIIEGQKAFTVGPSKDGWVENFRYGYFYEKKGSLWVYHQELGWLWAAEEGLPGWYYSADEDDFFYLDDDVWPASVLRDGIWERL